MLPPLPLYQQTLAGQATCTGIGLHTGAKVRLIMRPEPATSGILFVRSDVDGPNNQIRASAQNVVDTHRGTVIANQQGVQVSTIEHLLAALAAFAVDNVMIDLDGPEVPAMDGSAKVFAQMLAETGLVQQTAPREYIKILSTLSVTDGVAQASFSPSNRFEIDVQINYDNVIINNQNYHFDVNPSTFTSEIASARTFVLRSEIDALHRSGKALGGSLENCIVVGDTQIENHGELRFIDEFVRHKALDALGDLSLAGAPLLGCYQAKQVGHRMNHLALSALFADSSLWERVTLVDG
ncbi:MAG: UDP-3-O-[3-hydroxymyristoyl] N-acetylglucosamine deacetylase [Robiginitomaculum sp.]|nr:UDP-3-O-[3-hydroxymyristoyl] N-acetylglucosamine deacetylase [Robiginitomaculum sp.]